MKKRAEHEELLVDVLAGDESCRTAILERGLAASRRARTRRRAARITLTVVPLLILAAMLWRSQRGLAPRIAATPDISPIPPAPAQVAKTIEGTPIRVLTDEELLAFFKGRPVALLGEPGHQRLILFDETVQ